MDVAAQPSPGGDGAAAGQPEKSPWASINNMLIMNRCWICGTSFPRGKSKQVFQVSHLLTFYKNYSLHATAAVSSTVAPEENRAEPIAPPAAKSDGAVDDEAAIAAGAQVAAVAEAAVAISTSAGAVDAAAGGSGDQQQEAPAIDSNRGGDFISKNLRDCYRSYVSLMTLGDSGEEDPQHLFAEFKENDVETWMSGLVCGTTPDCKQELAYFIEQKEKSGATGATKAKKKSNLFSFASNNNPDCPPGCDCDNPWPFLSS